MNKQIILSGILSVLILSACRNMVTPVETPTPSVAPIATHTFSTLPGTPLPTPDFVPEDIYGIWTIWDQEAGGPNFITLNENGSFVVSHGPFPGVLLYAGTYTHEGNALTFLSWWFCEPDQRIGMYLLKVRNEKQWLFFVPRNDPCSERANDFRSRIVGWERFTPAETPNP
jgi:hypothetical protein